MYKVFCEKNLELQKLLEYHKYIFVMIHNLLALFVKHDIYYINCGHLYIYEKIIYVYPFIDFGT